MGRFGVSLGSLWGLLWDKRGGLRLEVVLGLGEIWGLFGVPHKENRQLTP